MKKSNAEIICEYGPFAGVERVNGVTYDGENVWLATGDKLSALDSRQRHHQAFAQRRRAGRNSL